MTRKTVWLQPATLTLSTGIAKVGIEISIDADAEIAEAPWVLAP